MDCTRYQGLLDTYGPNYENLKGRVGHLAKMCPLPGRP